jgi:hypothetical protein
LLALFKIQILRLWRTLKTGGPGLVLLPVFLAFIIARVYQFYVVSTDALLLSIGILLLLSLIHHNRKDHLFVLQAFRSARWQFFFEYSFFLLPLSIPALFTYQWYCFLFIHAAIALIVFIPPKRSFHKQQKPLSLPLDSADPELLIVLRKGLPIFVLLYVLALLLCHVRVASLVFIWFITIQLLSAFNQHESIDIIRWNHTSAGRFLKDKIIRQTRFLFFLFLPVVALHSFFVPEESTITLLLLLNLLILLALAIVMKYVSFQPGFLLSGGNFLLSFLAFLSLNPFFLPVPLVMLLLYYPKAIQRLNQYLYA